MSARQEILERIRTALRAPAPMPGAPDGASRAPRQAARDARGWLPPVPATIDEMRKLFARNAAELRAEFIVCSSESGADDRLREIAARENWQRIATHGSGIASALAASLKLPTLNVDGGNVDPNDLEACDAGITECEALIAQTGGVLVTSQRSGGRALSVLPPHHVVVARAEQLVADLPVAFELLHARYRGGWPSMISFVTGPSRTGDIERILVLGAHGPKKLTILLF